MNCLTDACSSGVTEAMTSERSSAAMLAFQSQYTSVSTHSASARESPSQEMAKDVTAWQCFFKSFCSSFLSRSFGHSGQGLSQVKGSDSVTRRGRLARVFFPCPESTLLPKELKRDVFYNFQ